MTRGWWDFVGRLGAVALIVCSIGCHSAALADPEEPLPRLTEQEAASVDVAVRTHTLLLQMAQQLEGKLDSSGDIAPARLEAVLKDTARRILDEYERVGLPRQRRSSVWNAMQGMGWSALVERIRGLRNWAMKLGRTQGLPAASGILLGTALNITVPIALVAVGLPQLIPVSVAAPYGPMIYGMTYMAQRQVLERRLATLYGGMQAYRQVQDAYREGRTQLGLRGMNDIVVPMFVAQDGTMTGAVVSRTGWFRSMLERFGWAAPSLTFHNLQRFLDEANGHTNFTRAVIADSRLTEEAKVTLLLQHITAQDDPKLAAWFRSRFHTNFVPLRQGPRFGDVLDWAVKVSQARTLGEIHGLFDQAPAGANARLIARVWSEIALPALLERADNLSFREVSSLRWQAERLVAAAELAPDAIWDRSWRHRFHSGMNEIVGRDRCRDTLSSLARPR